MLLSPFEIKGKTAPNRIVMPPMVRYTLNDTTGRVTPVSVEHYRKASRGVGLVVAEAFAVAPEGRLHPHMLGLWEDEQIEGAAALAEAIHQSGAVALLQLCYAGLCSKDPASAQVGPSEEYYDITRLARPLTVEEIHTIQRQHVEAALRAKAAGFDGVEVHGTHGYLYCRFMDRVSNRRRDEYGGGTAEGRTRIMTETLQAIRKEVGEDFILGARLGCNTPDFAVARENFRLVAKAPVDVLHLSRGTVMPRQEEGRPEGFPGNAVVWQGSLLAKETEKPVILSNQICTPAQAEGVLRQTGAAFAAVGRGILADPEWAQKAADGRPVDECLYCADCQWRIDHTRCPRAVMRERNKA
ncbi:MAG: NADH:flavin oxidoreductase [Oscillospiraceae bacterium]|nr:NADH:flavin oxidoreductase [Oscillospiraceae bacterium]